MMRGAGTTPRSTSRPTCWTSFPPLRPRRSEWRRRLPCGLAWRGRSWPSRATRRRWNRRTPAPWNSSKDDSSRSYSRFCEAWPASTTSARSSTREPRSGERSYASPSSRTTPACWSTDTSCWAPISPSSTISTLVSSTWTRRSGISGRSRTGPAHFGWGTTPEWRASPRRRSSSGCLATPIARLSVPTTPWRWRPNWSTPSRWPMRCSTRGSFTCGGANSTSSGTGRAVGTCLLGAANAGLGQSEQGLAQIRHGMDMYQGLKTPPLFWPLLLFVQAGAHARARKAAEGLTVIDEALKIAGRGSGMTLLPEFHLLKGDLLLALPHVNRADAELWFQRAFDVAQGLDARMPQLRAAVRLCRLRRVRANGDQGGRVLRAVYDTFTEGFTTADLAEANALLESV